MKIKHTLGFVAAAVLLASCASPVKQQPVIKVAVIGGMTRTGLWQELSKQFEARTGYQVKLVMTGPRELLAESFRAGNADLLTMHSGDISTDLVADGFGTDMRPWTRNEFVILGPKSDPAGIRGMHDGAAALERIAQTKSPFVDFQNIGTRELTTKLWKKAGIRPQGSWLLQDDSSSSEEVADFARSKDAYVILGRIPVTKGYIPAEGMDILVQGDPDMRRPFIVMEANPKKFPGANIRGARALSDFLLSAKTQDFLLEFGTNSPGGIPLFFPVNRD